MKLLYVLALMRNLKLRGAPERKSQKPGGGSCWGRDEKEVPAPDDRILVATIIKHQLVALCM